jgi:subtilase family serine protease
MAATALVAMTAGARADVPAVPTVTHAINDSLTVNIPGNIRPEVAVSTDLGRIDGQTRFPHVLLQLKRSAARAAALEHYISQLHDKTSPLFHKWLTKAELNARFGVADADLAAVETWLTGHGFTINGYTPNLMLDVSGTAAAIRASFGMDIHHILYEGASHIANVTEPRVPEALAGVLVGPPSIHDFKMRTYAVRRGHSVNYTYTGSNGTEQALAPADLQTIYNLTPLYAQGLTGAGQTIVAIEDTESLYQRRLVRVPQSAWPEPPVSAGNADGGAPRDDAQQHLHRSR